MSTPRLQDSVA